MHRNTKAATEDHQIGIKGCNRGVNGNTHRCWPRRPAQKSRLRLHPKTAPKDFPLTSLRQVPTAAIWRLNAVPELVVSTQPRLPHKHCSPLISTVM